MADNGRRYPRWLRLSWYVYRIGTNRGRCLVRLYFTCPFSMCLSNLNLKALLALLAAASIGCGGSASPTGTQAGNSGSSTRSNEESLSPGAVSESVGTIEPADELTIWNESNASQAAIPASIPVYPDAVPNHGMSTEGFFTMFWKTTGERTEVMEFYERALVDAGWNVTSDPAHGRFDGEQSGRKLQIYVVGMNQPTLIIAQMSQKEETASGD